LAVTEDSGIVKDFLFVDRRLRIMQGLEKAREKQWQIRKEHLRVNS
jgi:hypothetical protein